MDRAGSGGKTRKELVKVDFLFNRDLKILPELFIFFSAELTVALDLGDVSHVVSTSVLVHVLICGNTKVFNPFVSSLLYPPILVGRETRENHHKERTWSHNNTLKLMPWETSVLAREMLPVKGKDPEP